MLNCSNSFKVVTRLALVCSNHQDHPIESTQIISLFLMRFALAIVHSFLLPRFIHIIFIGSLNSLVVTHKKNGYHALFCLPTTQVSNFLLFFGH